MDKPNLVMSSAVQVVWEKFANYWEVEPRYVPVTEDHPTLDGFEIGKYVDENTVIVLAIQTDLYRRLRAVTPSPAWTTCRRRRGLTRSRVTSQGVCRAIPAT